MANLQYIRHRDFFVILASEGEHIFKQREVSRLQDVRRKGIEHGGYLISFRNGHVQVRIDDETYRQLKAHHVGLALHRTKESLITEFYAAPFEPYSPIKRQIFNILREVNRVRKVAGFEQIPSSAIWLKRRILKPFAGVTVQMRHESSVSQRHGICYFRFSAVMKILSSRISKSSLTSLT